MSRLLNYEIPPHLNLMFPSINQNMAFLSAVTHLKNEKSIKKQKREKISNSFPVRIFNLLI